MSDLVERLREVAERPDANYTATMLNAAARIEALEAALRQVIAIGGQPHYGDDHTARRCNGRCSRRTGKGTHMSDELRERVAMVNCAGDQWDKPCKVPCVDCLREADAAIALIRAEVLEEAAKVAETTFGEGYHIAAAIRALEART